MFNLVLFGPPGSGKGTQSENISNKYGLIHLSTGELLRAEKRTGSALGDEIKRLIDKGEYVSDQMAQQMVEPFITKNQHARGFIFDGFPRTTNQAKWLDDFLLRFNAKIDLMMALSVDDHELANRLLNRSVNSGRIDDQNEEIIRKRIEIYHHQTHPVMEYYKTQQKYYSVDGIGSLNEVLGRINQVVTELI